MGSLWRELRHALRRRRTRAVGQRNGSDRPAQGPERLALARTKRRASDGLMRSPRLVQGRSMEPFREVEAWVESYFFCSSVLLALASSLGSNKEQ